MENRNLRLLFSTIFLAVIWFMTSIACNYPGIPKSGDDISVEHLRQTVQAQMIVTTTADAQEFQNNPATTPTVLDKGTPLFATPSLSASEIQGGPAGAYTYLSQSGDTLQSVARHFRVETGQISSPQDLPAEGYLPPGQVLWIPVAFQYPDTDPLLPDSEVIYSPTAGDSDLHTFINQAGGLLNTYHEDVDGQNLSGAEIIERVSNESSINPRLLLAFLEYRSGWVFGQPNYPAALEHPLGFNVPGKNGLYQELVMAATHLNLGYYGWRSGEFSSFKFSDGSITPVNPILNAGSVGLQNLFAKFYKPTTWADALYGEDNFLGHYRDLFGDPNIRASRIEPILTPELAQPQLELPFAPGERWSLTGGPHYSWNTGSPRGALDFSPVTGEPNCSISSAWVTAPADGVIIRSKNNVLALDLDGDGLESTGWVIILLHIADKDRVPSGIRVNVNDKLGHPSCERGSSTGTHVHIARKYDGEWLPADAAVPFVLSGWRVVAGPRNYQGSLVKGDQEIDANPGGPRTSIIVR
jgi:LasA protease